MNKKSKLLIVFAWCLIIFTSCADAAVHISANPIDGGNSLRFGRVDGSMRVNKTVRLRVTSDEGKQYQIYQRLQYPLVNEQHVYLGEQTLTTYAVSGSNASGTLYAQSNEPLGASDQLVFTSSPDGSSDTVTLDYLVNSDRINSSGNFIGRIAYTVRSLAGGSQDQALINVDLDAAGTFKASVRGAKHFDRVYLESSQRALTQDGIKIAFEGNFRDELKVYQETRDFPTNEQGEKIGPDSVQFFVTGQGAGNIRPAPEGLGYKRELLYQSREEENELVVNFMINPQKTAHLKAGLYRGRIVVIIDSSHGVQEFPLDLEVKIDPVFDIEVILPSQGVRFTRVLPTDPPQTQEVTVKVISNLGKSYVVMQNVASALVTPKGDEIKEEYFLLKAELINNSSGKIQSSEFVPVGVGEKSIFYSDRDGSSAEFKVIYRLSSYPEIAAGDYGVPIIFSLGEM